MPHLLKVTHHIALGRQGWGETHYWYNSGDFNGFDAVVAASQTLGTARKSLLGSDASIDGCTITLADPAFFGIGGNTKSWPIGKPANFVRLAEFDNAKGNRGNGNPQPGAGLTKTSAAPWLGALFRFTGRPFGYFNRTLIMRAMPPTYVPYDPTNAGAPGLPNAQFTQAYADYSAALDITKTTGAWGFITQRISPTVPNLYQIIDIVVEANDKSRTFEYRVPDPTVFEPGDVVIISGARGPGLRGANGRTRVVSKEGDIIRTRLHQDEPCDIIYTPNSAYIGLAQFTFCQYLDVQYERTVKRDTGLPYVHTKGRQSKAHCQPPAFNL